MSRSGWLPLCLMLGLGLALGDAAVAADAGSTFDSFYRPGAGADWGMAGLGAAAAGILVLVGLPVASTPLLSTIGSSLGGMFGLPGVAATGFGLSLLGAGTMVAGGFGPEVHDPATYEAARFAEASARMVSLPIPVIAGKAESVRAAGRVFETSAVGDGWACARKHADAPDEFRTCIASQQKLQRQLVRSALSVMRTYGPATDPVAAERESALLALLHFANNDYSAARQAASRAYDLGLKGSSTPTLPAFLAATSMLYEERPNFGESFARFQYSITAEPRNPLTPVLFAAYLDRLSYRLHDRAAVAADLDRVVAFVASLNDDGRKVAVQQILLAHHLAQTRAAQQRVTALLGARNRVTRAEQATLDAVKTSAGDYSALLATGKALVDRQEKLLPVSDREAMLQPYRQALASQQREQAALSERVASLERDVVAAKPAEGAPPKAKTELAAKPEPPARPEQAAKPEPRLEPQATPEPQPSGESGLSSIFNRVRGLFK